MHYAWTGLALGLAGLGEVCLRFIPGSHWAENVFMFASLVIWLSFTAHRLLHPGHTLNEFASSPAALCAWGVWQMTFLLQWRKWMPPFENSDENWIIIGVWFGFILQIIIMLCFFRLCARLKLAVEPMFFPVTVDAAMTAIVGYSYGTNGIRLATFSLWLALAAICFLVPPCIYNIVRNDEIACDASIGILQAPVSIVCHAWNLCRQRRILLFSSGADAAVHIFLFALTALLLLLTAWASWRRRAALLIQLNISWSAFTFPLCATAIATLEFDSRARTSSSGIIRGLVFYYAATIAILAFSIVALVLFIVLAQLLGILENEAFSPKISTTTTSYYNPDDEKQDDLYLHDALLSIKEGLPFPAASSRDRKNKRIPNEKTSLLLFSSL